MNTGLRNTAGIVVMDPGSWLRSARDDSFGTRGSLFSLVQPYILVAVAVVGAVDHDGHALDVGMPAGRLPHVQDDRPRHVFLNLLVDLPDELLALLRIALHRLLVEQLLQLLVAIMGVIALGSAGVILVKSLIGIVDGVAG